MKTASASKAVLTAPMESSATAETQLPASLPGEGCSMSSAATTMFTSARRILGGPSAFILSGHLASACQNSV